MHFNRRDDLYARLKEEKISDLEKHHIYVAGRQATQVLEYWMSKTNVKHIHYDKSK